MASLCFAVHLLVRWVPAPFSADLEYSWKLALNVAFADGLVFGRDVVFTFGPLGFLYDPVCFVATRHLALVLRIVVALAFWVAVFGMAWRRIEEWWVALGWLVAVIVLAGILPDTLFLTLPLLLLVAHFHPRATSAWVKAALVLVVALAGLVKFPYLLAGAAAASVIAADDVLRARRVPWAAGLFGLAIVAGWVAAEQPLAALPDWIATSMELARGYGAAMSLPLSGRDLALALGTMALVLATVVAGESGRPSTWMLLPVTGVAAQLLLALKAGFVRFAYDGHALITASTLLMTVLLYLPLRRVRALGVVTCVAASGLTWWLAGPTLGALPVQLFGAVTTIPATVRAAAGLAHDPGALDAGCLDAAAKMRRALPVAPTIGTVDVYPWLLVVPIAHGFRYAPRPSLQSYVAYTPALARLNAAHLRGPLAPDTILFDVWPIDGRLPALDDGPSWPELLTRYQIAGNLGFLRLERTVPRAFVLTPIGDVVAHLGDVIPVPATDAPVWATVDVHLRALGQIADALLAIPQPEVALVTTDAVRRHHRLVPGMAAAGFLLSPYVEERNGFALFAAGRTVTIPTTGHEFPPRAVSLAIAVPPGAESFYADDVRVAFFELRFPPHDLRGLPGLELLNAALEEPRT